eukprot:364901-Chlamydomonas_euryale.AAC.3
MSHWYRICPADLEAAQVVPQIWRPHRVSRRSQTLSSSWKGGYEQATGPRGHAGRHARTTLCPASRCRTSDANNPAHRCGTNGTARSVNLHVVTPPAWAAPQNIACPTDLCPV